MMQYQAIAQRVVLHDQPEAGESYDGGLQDYFNAHMPELLPQLLEGARYQDAVDVTIIRPTMRADRVYRALYRNEPHIIHFEIQIAYEKRFPARLHVYNSVLHYDHGLPVITIVVYPFRTHVVDSPYRVTSGNKELLRFEFVVMPLFEQDARKFVENRVLCMYPLLPTMRHVDQALMRRAVEELIAFYAEDEYTLAREFLWLNLMLNRTDTISDREKEHIQEMLYMFQRLLDEDPTIQKIKAAAESKGQDEGQVKASRQAIIAITAARFPALKELAQQWAAQIQEPLALDALLGKLTLADEQSVRTLLTQPIPGSD